MLGVGRALGHRNYRLFFVGQGTSLIGTWMTRVAVAWLVYRLTSSALLLGLVGFAGQLPTFLIAPVGGALVDRWDRRRLLVASQVLSAVQSGLLAVFTLTHTITMPSVLALVAFQGLINAFDTPARQAFVVEMVDRREDLPNAIALNSVLVNGARLIGPAIAGVLIAAYGEGWCFTVDAASYVAVVASLLAMRVKPRPARPRRHLWLELREGLSYVASHRAIRTVLSMLALVSLVGMPYVTLMPVFARDVLGGGPHTLGALTGASGAGALVGGLWLAARRTASALPRVLELTGLVFGAGLVALGLSEVLWLSLALMVVTGTGMMVLISVSNTLVQTLVEEDKRGRVMSFYTMAFFGMAPFGALAFGALAQRVGAPITVIAGGVATVAVTMLLTRAAPARRETHGVR